MIAQPMAYSTATSGEIASRKRPITDLPKFVKQERLRVVGISEIRSRTWESVKQEKIQYLKQSSKGAFLHFPSQKIVILSPQAEMNFRRSDFVL